MTACPVCSVSLADFDEAASAHHVNLCLDGDGPSGSGSASKSDVNTLVHAPICPICNSPVQDDVQLEEHVELCLVAQSGSAGTSTGRASPASEACPSCLIDWSAIEVPFAAREQHVMDCLAQREALAEDGSDEEQGHWDTADELGDSGSHPHFRSLLSAKGLQNGFGKLKSSIKGKGRADPNTPDLVPLLSLLLERAFSSSNAATRSATLCTPNAVHIKSQSGDFGWGCGYRNAQMVLTAASRLQQYRDLFTDGSVSEEASANGNGPSHKRKECPNEQSMPDIPEIAQLQEIAEAAWKKGFDPEGRDHFKGKLIGSRRWIGTSEVYVMLTWIGIRATIIDFPKDKQSRKSGPNSTHHALTKWVFDYFGTSLPDQEQNGGSHSSGEKNAFSAIMSTGGSAIRVTHDRLPLYLQHQGHSRTIVGVEVNKNGDLNLLVFDPGHAVPKTLREAALATARAGSTGESIAKKAKNGATAASLDVSDHHRLLSAFRVNLKSLSRQDEYQILRIDAEGPALSPEEKMRRRAIKSVEVTG